MMGFYNCMDIILLPRSNSFVLSIKIEKASIDTARNVTKSSKRPFWLNSANVRTKIGDILVELN